MAVSVVQDGPFWNPLTPVFRSAATVTGALLRILAGITFSAGVIVGFYWVGTVIDEEQSLPKEIGGYSPGWLTVGLLSLGVIAGSIGRRLVARRRKLVLFLRRFRYDDATAAVLAATESLGRTWRMVTLDDAEIQPVEAAPVLRRSFTGLTRTADAVSQTRRLLARGVRAAYTVIVVGGLVVAWWMWDDMSGEEALDTVDSTTRSIAPVAEEWAVPVLIGAGVLGLLWLVLAVTMSAVRLGDRSLQTAQEHRYLEVHGLHDIEVVSAKLAERERAVFNPRLMVAKVDSSVWQPTVTRLAELCDVVLFDVSRPSENLAWEIETVLAQEEGRCVFIGQLDALRRFATDSESPGKSRRRLEVIAVPPQSLLARIDRLLDGREVIGYRSDAKGLRRFRRALRAELEALPD